MDLHDALSGRARDHRAAPESSLWASLPAGRRIPGKPSDAVMEGKEPGTDRGGEVE